MKQDITLEFCKCQNKDICILAESHVNHEQIHHIRNNYLGPIIFSPGDTFSKGILILLHPGFSVTEVDSDPKGRFVSFKVGPSDDRVFCVYVPSGHSTRERLARRCFFEELQMYMENQFKGNENKIIGDFNCILDKMDGDEGNKTQKYCRYLSNFALSKLIMENRLEDLWRRENTDISEFTCYDRPSDTRPRIGRVHTDIK